MDRIVHTSATAVGLFASTNVEDFMMLTVLFLSYRTDGQPRPRQIGRTALTGNPDPGRSSPATTPGTSR